MTTGKLERIRVSIGSAILLGLMEGIIDAKPTTIYLLTYIEGRCTANCGFCPQARESRGRADMLSRVIWPPFRVANVIPRIAEAYKDGEIKRTCIQALNYPGVVDDIMFLVGEIRGISKVPISVSCQPLSREDMVNLMKAGVNRVSIALDCSTKELFERIKGSEAGGPYKWESHLKALKEAVEVFGRGSVTTHLIIGLGESEEEAIRMIQSCMDMGVYPALFAFTPIPGTRLENNPQPPLGYYRRVQLAHYLVTKSIARYEDMEFRDGHLTSFGVPVRLLKSIVRSGEPFRTSGCPGCNRPYYNERPSGPIYNYAWKPRPEEIAEIERQIKLPEEGNRDRLI